MKHAASIALLADTADKRQAIRTGSMPWGEQQHFSYPLQVTSWTQSDLGVCPMQHNADAVIGKQQHTPAGRTVAKALWLAGASFRSRTTGHTLPIMDTTGSAVILSVSKVNLHSWFTK
jgi:hypothetical protein